MAALSSVGGVVVSSISGISLSNFKIKNLLTCTVDSDLANKFYVDSRVSGVTNIGTGAPVLKSSGITNLVFARTLVGNGYTSANDNTQLYINYDLYDLSFPQNRIDTTSVSLPNLQDKWVGGVLAMDGKIYCVPSSYTSVLIYDTYLGPGGRTYDTTTLVGNGIVGNSGWFGGVLAPNGKIYCIPYNATNVLIVDPILKTTDTTTLAGLPGTTKWAGGVLSPNGKIYCVPYSSSSVLIIDPNRNILDTTTISGLSGTNKWRGGVLAPTGSIYCCPSDITTMLIINTNSNIPNTTSIVGFPNTANKWACGTLSPTNGSIYFAPNTETRVLIVTPPSNVVNTTTITTNFGGSKWFGATLGGNGNIYCPPQATTQVLIINPSTNTSSLTSMSGFPNTGQSFSGGVLSANGSIYFVPDDITYLGVVGSGICNVQILQAFSSYYNKL